MKAKDTVMSMEEIDHIRKSTVARDMCDSAREEGRKAGIREVVDCINMNGFDGEERHPDGIVPAKVIHQTLWQAKLKEWGIE